MPIHNIKDSLGEQRSLWYLCKHFSVFQTLAQVKWTQCLIPHLPTLLGLLATKCGPKMQHAGTAPHRFSNVGLCWKNIYQQGGQISKIWVNLDKMGRIHGFINEMLDQNVGPFALGFLSVLYRATHMQVDKMVVFYLLL